MALTTLPDETNILKKVASGDKYAFTLLFNHYQRFVYSFGKKLTHSDDISIDLVQDVFLKIWEMRDKLLEIENFGAYLNRMVRNHSFNKLRDSISKSIIKTDLEEAANEVELSTIQQIDYNETLKLVEQAISKLSPQQRKAYELCHQQGLSYEEASEALGISKQTVHVHIKLALKKIREFLKDNSVIYPLIAMILYK